MPPVPTEDNDIELDEGDMFEVQESRELPPSTQEQRVPWAREKGIKDTDIVSEDEEVEELIGRGVLEETHRKRELDRARNEFVEAKSGLSKEEKKEFDLDVKILEKFFDVVATKKEVDELGKKLDEFKDKIAEYRAGTKELKTVGKAIYKKPKETFVKAKDMEEWAAVHQEANGAPTSIDENLLEDDFSYEDKKWFKQGDVMDKLSAQIAAKKAELARFGVFSIFSKEKRAQKAQLKADIVNLELQIQEELLSAQKTEKRIEDIPQTERAREVAPDKTVPDLGKKVGRKIGKLATGVAAAGLAMSAVGAQEAANYQAKKRAAHEIAEFQAGEEEAISEKDVVVDETDVVVDKTKTIFRNKRPRAQVFIPPEKKPFVMEQYAAPVIDKPKTPKPYKKIESHVAKGAGGIDIVTHKPFSSKAAREERERARKGIAEDNE